MKKSLLTLFTLLLLSAVLETKAQDDSDFACTTNSGMITITGYWGDASDLTIPESIYGLPVTEIGESAFQGDVNLAHLTLPGTIARIGNWAFYECPSLKDVAISSSVIEIGLSAFGKCPSLEAFAVDPANPAYLSVDGVLLNKDQTMVIQYPAAKFGNYVIPESVTDILDYAFEDCVGLTEVTLPHGLTNLALRAFCGCTSLGSVAIPGGVSRIEQEAFAYCNSLTNLIFSEGLKEIGSGAFIDCYFLSSFVVPASVREIESEAFMACDCITSVFFKGDAPVGAEQAHGGGEISMLYYLPGTTGWEEVPLPEMMALWNPQIDLSSPSFGMRSNRFILPLTGTPDIPIVVEACTNLANPIWLPVQSCTLTDGSLEVTDPRPANDPARFYRVRSP